MPSWTAGGSTANQPRALINLEPEDSRLAALLKAARQTAAGILKLARRGARHLLCDAVRFDGASEGGSRRPNDADSERSRGRALDTAALTPDETEHCHRAGREKWMCVHDVDMSMRAVPPNESR